jgi:predicted Rdx family selenoprotein
LRARAGRLATSIEQTLGVRPRIRVGGFQAFDVYVDGRLVYGRKRDGELPSDEAILARIRSIEGGSA